jgi:hypothetical protein
MYQMIEARVAVHPKLLRLSGRLDLAMSQVRNTFVVINTEPVTTVVIIIIIITIIQVSLRGKTNTPSIQEPLVVYKDDAGDAHDAMASGSSSEESEAEEGSEEGMSQASGCCLCPLLLHDLLLQDDESDSDASDGDGGADDGEDGDSDGDDDDDDGDDDE